MKEREEHRADFIKEMYRVYWANMARSMEGVWKVLAPITVAGTIVAGVHKNYLPAPLGIALAIAVILWALNLTIDLNAWHRRNLFFAAKAEQIFLTRTDYGRLLPVEYETPKKGWVTFYEINAAAFAVFLVLVIVYAVVWKRLHVCLVDEWLLPLVVLTVGLALTGYNAWAQEESAQRHFKELFGNGSPPGTVQENTEGEDAS